VSTFSEGPAHDNARPDVGALDLHLVRGGVREGDPPAANLSPRWSPSTGVLLTGWRYELPGSASELACLNIWGHSPATLAMLATSLHGVSGGRFILGLGAGSPQPRARTTSR
jgi:hypothetical protein